MTASQILAATDGTTPHNSYSLKLIGDRFGYRLKTDKNRQGRMTYFFASRSRKAAGTKR